MNDERIALTPFVELSYLIEREQYDFMNIMESEECTPSLSQAGLMKKLSKAVTLNADKSLSIMSKAKANQKERIIFNYEDIRHFFHKSY